MKIKQQIGVPSRHHLDQRAAEITSRLEPTLAEERLVSTRELALRLGVSEQWLEIGRSRGYGPPFVKLAPRRVRYNMKDVLAYLEARTFTCTAQFSRRDSKAA